MHYSIYFFFQISLLNPKNDCTKWSGYRVWAHKWTVYIGASKSRCIKINGWHATEMTNRNGWKLPTPFTTERLPANTAATAVRWLLIWLRYYIVQRTCAGSVPIWMGGWQRNAFLQSKWFWPCCRSRPVQKWLENSFARHAARISAVCLEVFCAPVCFWWARAYRTGTYCLIWWMLDTDGVECPPRWIYKVHAGKWIINFVNVSIRGSSTTK